MSLDIIYNIYSCTNLLTTWIASYICFQLRLFHIIFV
nr:MAG TPA: hypothetical protein [Caudoviricetes sp.]